MITRAEAEDLSGLRFPNTHLPRRALAGCNVTQMHYARKGVVTPEMEYIARRESMDRANSSITPEFVRSAPAQGFLE